MGKFLGFLICISLAVAVTLGFTSGVIPAFFEWLPDWVLFVGAAILGGVVTMVILVRRLALSWWP